MREAYKTEVATNSGLVARIKSESDRADKAEASVRALSSCKIRIHQSYHNGPDTLGFSAFACKQELEHMGLEFVVHMWASQMRNALSEHFLTGDAACR